MSILSDKEIKELCKETPMISPFVGNQVRQRRETMAEYQDRVEKARELMPEGHIYPDGDTAFNFYGNEPENFRKVISYGLSSYGYDLRIADEFKIFTNINSTVVDPLAFDDKSFVDFKGDVCIIPPNSFVLAHSIEYLKMPEDVTGIVLGKSTYARCGNVCIATPLEAGWTGQVTLEFANTTPLPMKLYANQGAAQVLFFKGNIPPEVSYAARNGKYQGQLGITLPKG